MPQNKKEALKSIRTSTLLRGFSLAKATLKASRLGAGRWLDSSEKNSPAWLSQVELLVGELGRLKGSAVKVGQTLSMYGEHLLPPEVNQLLKKLQQDSPRLEWAAISKVLEKELGKEKLSRLEIDETPIAAASIGQVHRARVKATGRDLALKVQYPGVDQAIETDLKLLKFILTMTNMVPKGPRFDQIFAEIKDMFYQEVDYHAERRFHERFHQWLKDDPRYLVPEVAPEFSTRRVLASDFMEGDRIDSARVQALSQDDRNRLGRNFFELYCRELLDFRFVQTDPHFGNYLISPDQRLILLDFGAVREVPSDFLKAYVLIVEGGLKQDTRLIEQGSRRLGLLQPEDSLELIQDYIDLCLLLREPIHGVYDWGSSDLPKRVAAKASKIALTHKLRAPPRELVFLDRKLGGVFVFLSGLKSKIETRDLVENALKSARPSLDRE